MAENTEIASSPRKQENKSILSLLPKFQLNLPFFFNQQPKKAEETVVSKGTAKTSTVSEAHDGNASSVKPSLARFPDATRPILPPPIELEAEEPAGRTSNPVVLWQVYALGGFLVMRWIWARWQERKERSGKKDSDDKNESSPADEDDSFHSA